MRKVRDLQNVGTVRGRSGGRKGNGTAGSGGCEPTQTNQARSCTRHTNFTPFWSALWSGATEAAASEQQQQIGASRVARLVDHNQLKGKYF